MITIETIRQLESDSANFDARIEFSRHARKIIDTAYTGVQKTSAGGLLRSDAAIAIDRALADVFRRAGYEADDYSELAAAIWAKKQ